MSDSVKAERTESWSYFWRKAQLFLSLKKKAKRCQENSPILSTKSPEVKNDLKKRKRKENCLL